MIIGMLAIKIINKHNVNAVYWFKSQTTSHGGFMFMLLLLSGIYDVT